MHRFLSGEDTREIVRFSMKNYCIVFHSGEDTREIEYKTPERSSIRHQRDRVERLFM
jgi:hypothetical protein